MRDAVPVHAWPEGRGLALQALRSESALTVIRVAVPEAASRSVAREQIRGALSETIAALFDWPLASVRLVSQAGCAIRLDVPGTQLGLAVSHAAGLSVAAIRVGGAVGVDVMRVNADELPDWECVAQDYLGPLVLGRLAKLAPAPRAAAFAQEWMLLEACLKCLGMGLAEWTPALASQCAACSIRELALPDGYGGAVAVGR